MALSEYPISVEQLCVGVYVRFEGKSPFLRKSLLIKSQDQIDKIRKAGVSKVICVLDKCEHMPIPPEKLQKPQAKPVKEGPKTPVSREILGLKRETIEKNKERRERFAKCEKKYEQAMGQVSTLMRRASARSNDAVADLSTLVTSLSKVFLSDKDTMINLMASKPQEEQKNYHSLNVTVLSMMVGKEAKLKPEVMQILGMACLFHDIGKGRVPVQSLKRGQATTMTRLEEQYYKEHPLRGVNILQDTPDFPQAGLPVVMQHHEAMDGSGFPKKLPGDKISPLSRIVAIANAYDHLLNVKEEQKPMTPHHALKHMYGNMRHKLDPKLMGVFIKLMGVFPAGTVVQLSNGAYGMVVGTRTSNPARPSVLIYHKEIPKKEALIVDMSIEEDLEIKKVFSPADLPQEVLGYLSPSRNINYYADNAP